MTAIQRFADYAAAFEKTFETDDFSHIEPFFTKDAVYEIFGGPPFAGLHEGRDAIFNYLKLSLDGFDRRFATRALDVIEGPEERGDDAVWMRWRVVYTRPGLPDLAIEGEETVEFDGTCIRRLEDRFTDDASARTLAYFEEHGARLAEDL